MKREDLEIGQFYVVDERLGKLLSWVTSKKVKLKMEFSTLVCNWEELEEPDFKGKHFFRAEYKEGENGVIATVWFGYQGFDLVERITDGDVSAQEKAEWFVSMFKKAIDNFAVHSIGWKKTTEETPPEKCWLAVKYAEEGYSVCQYKSDQWNTINPYEWLKLPPNEST